MKNSIYVIMIIYKRASKKRRKGVGKTLKNFGIGLFLLIIITCFGIKIVPLYEIQAAGNKVQQGTYDDNIQWRYEDGVFTISGTGTIPEAFASILTRSDDTRFALSEIKEIKVEQGITELGERSLGGCDEATKITLPEGLRKIGNSALRDCDELEEINLPDGLESIGKYAFAWDRTIKEIKIPESVSEIGDRAFYECWGLTNINVPKEMKYLSNGMFEGCMSLKSIQLPSNLERIGEATFSRCYELENIQIPETVYSIGERTFNRCEKMKQITLPKQLKTISNSMFWGCISLTRIDFSANLKKIGDKAFSNCTNLEEIKLPETVSDIGDGAFSDCEKLKKIKLPDGLTNISDDMFSGCKRLMEFQFPQSVQRIGANAFEGCRGLKYIVVPDTVTQIGEEAFCECKGLECIKLSKNIQVLREETFRECSSLTSIEIPSSVITLEDDIVVGCDKLRLIIIPKSVISISEYSIRSTTATIVGEEKSRIEEYVQKNNLKFIKYNEWKCNHFYSYEILKIATLQEDGLRMGRCVKCGNTVLETLSHPISIKQKGDGLRYNGEKQVPLVEIKLANGEILKNRYYECKGEGNVNVGSYRIQFDLENGYEGTMECTYKIIKRSTQVFYQGKDVLLGSYNCPFSLSVYANGIHPEIIYKVSDPKILSVNKEGKVHAKRVGSCVVTAYTEANNNFIKSNEVKVKVKIIPAKVTVKSIKARSGRKIYLKWNRDSKVDGYMIEYATKKSLLDVKVIQTRSNKTTNITLKKLKRNKKYYVMIRGYKKVKSGKRYRDEIGPVTKKTIKTK